MYSSLKIGEVIEVRGNKVKILVDKSLNHSTFIYNGEIIKNVTVNAFIIINQGNTDIVGKIESEYIVDLLNDNKKLDRDRRFAKDSIKRIIEVQIVGYIDEKFESGSKKLPMIGNLVFIPTSKQIKAIYLGNKVNSSNYNMENSINIKIGQTMFENFPVEIPINSLFASHIGIFGNTGSGKSNTLTKIYHQLFESVPYYMMLGKSKFILIDFNGEYTNKKIFGLPEDIKELIDLNTRNDNGKKIIINEDIFFNSEILSILFNATEQTQKPFITRVINNKKWADANNLTLEMWAPKLLKKMLTSVSISKEGFDLFKEAISELFSENESKHFMDKINKLSWFSRDGKLYVEGTNIYFDGGNLDDKKISYSGIPECEDLMNKHLASKDIFDKLIFRFRLQLVSDLLKKHAQFDHINPLINRAKSRIKDLKKVLSIGNTQENSNALITIISLRNCNIETKKLVPLLTAKMIFNEHKNNTKQENIDRTVHLIIDEAHNILSSQSNRESNEWKDYRLELFEEIIKEGRKFGFFLTIASQRPADISPTIISQIHNFFIHRLVNNKDLELLDNTISTLDLVSKKSIPTLSPGSCIITGTAFLMPIFANIYHIKEKEFRPSSDNIDLTSLWEISDLDKLEDIERSGQEMELV